MIRIFIIIIIIDTNSHRSDTTTALPTHARLTREYRVLITIDDNTTRVMWTRRAVGYVVCTIIVMVLLSSL